MKKLLLVTLLFTSSLFTSSAFASSAFAKDLIANPTPDLSVRLKGDSCPKEVANLIDPRFRDEFRYAIAIVYKKEMKACWILTNTGDVFLHYEDDDIGKIPSSMFKVALDI